MKICRDCGSPQVMPRYSRCRACLRAHERQLDRDRMAGYRIRPPRGTKPVKQYTADGCVRVSIRRTKVIVYCGATRTVTKLHNPHVADFLVYAYQKKGYMLVRRKHQAVYLEKRAA